MKAFWISVFLTFWAEMGDRTQFLAVAYATRNRLRDVLIGIAWGTAAVLLVAVLVGKFIASWVPVGWVQAASALSFLVFGILTLRGDEKEEQIPQNAVHPIVVIGATFFLAELGDKTILTTIALAATWSWIPVWMGATLGMLLSDGLGVYVGKVLGRHIPQKTMKRLTAGLFFVFAVWYGWQATQRFSLSTVH
jgi:putative Ca2+/H+ antiporter (TMEM165/GDT1 family)